ncbi:MAG: S41 family peptidase [Pseudomonadales bacterium]|nr:S41 family peptidase [Pseudomonadales bacterium]
MMKMNSTGNFVSLLVALILTVCHTFARAQEELTTADKLYGLSQFWKEVSYNFVYFDQVEGIDWDEIYKAYLTEVLESDNAFEYYRVMKKFAALLKDGGTRVDFPRWLSERYIAFPGIQLIEVDHKAYVVAVVEELGGRIPLKSQLLAIDGEPIQAVLEREVFPYISSSTEAWKWYEGVRGDMARGYGLLAGPRDSRATLTFELPDGTLLEEEVTRDITGLSGSDWVSLIDLPDDTIEFQWLDDGVAYLTFNSFTDPDMINQFRAMLDELGNARALIIDLRHNAGGNTLIVEDLLGFMTYRDLLGAKSRTRINNSVYRAFGGFSDLFEFAKEYEPYATGEVFGEIESDVLVSDETNMEEKIIMPTAVLIGIETSGAAEDFLIYASQLPHFIFVGEPSNGNSGQSLYFGMPLGGEASVRAKRDTFPDGSDYIGLGIQPHVPVNWDPLSDKDETLLKAQEIILNEDINSIKEKRTAMLP